MITWKKCLYVQERKITRLYCHRFYTPTNTRMQVYYFVLLIRLFHLILSAFFVCEFDAIYFLTFGVELAPETRILTWLSVFVFHSYSLFCISFYTMVLMVRSYVTIFNVNFNWTSISVSFESLHGAHCTAHQILS